MSLPALALILALVLAVPAALVASWRMWPRDGSWSGARIMDAVWTLVPPALLGGLLVLAAGAGL
jgi:heme/copper-type cytochrome/quinol oxidase subunit 2